MLVSAVSTTKWNAGNYVKLYATNQASVMLPNSVLENFISNPIRTHFSVYLLIFSTVLYIVGIMYLSIKEEYILRVITRY